MKIESYIKISYKFVDLIYHISPFVRLVSRSTRSKEDIMIVCFLNNESHLSAGARQSRGAHSGKYSIWSVPWLIGSVCRDATYPSYTTARGSHWW